MSVVIGIVKVQKKGKVEIMKNATAIISEFLIIRYLRINSSFLFLSNRMKFAKSARMAKRPPRSKAYSIETFCAGI